MKLYRYERNILSILDDEGVYDEDKEPKVALRTFDVKRETPKCYFIWLSPFKEKRVLKNAKSTFAYDTKEQALINYQKRTQRNHSFCYHNLKVAKIFLEHSKSLTTLQAV